MAKTYDELHYLSCNVHWLVSNGVGVGEDMIRLGLIGDNIAHSKSPMLHTLAARICGLEASYELLVPARAGLDFDALLARCRDEGYRGVNVTYPYKERVFPRLRVADETVRAMGACNTVLFGADVPAGANTDYSGFVRAFNESFPATMPGRVAMVGSGGVGKAIAFALLRLGAQELRIFDTDPFRADTLARSLMAVSPAMRVLTASSVEEATRDCDGVVNCTPVGMVGIPGTAVPRRLMSGARWAFDAVYTPVDTIFMKDARAEGLATITGYELFFHQGVDGFLAFTGIEVPGELLREALLNAEEGACA